MSLKIHLNRQKTLPIKVCDFGKKYSNKETSTTNIKTLAEILNLDKEKTINNEYFLQTYKEEDRDFMKQKIEIEDNNYQRNCKYNNFNNAVFKN